MSIEVQEPVQRFPKTFRDGMFKALRILEHHQKHFSDLFEETYMRLQVIVHSRTNSDSTYSSSKRYFIVLYENGDVYLEPLFEDRNSRDMTVGRLLPEGGLVLHQDDPDRLSNDKRTGYDFGWGDDPILIKNSLELALDEWHRKIVSMFTLETQICNKLDTRALPAATRANFDSDGVMDKLSESEFDRLTISWSGQPISQSGLGYFEAERLRWSIRAHNPANISWLLGYSTGGGDYFQLWQADPAKELPFDKPRQRREWIRIFEDALSAAINTDSLISRVVALDYLYQVLGTATSFPKVTEVMRTRDPELADSFERVAQVALENIAWLKEWVEIKGEEVKNLLPDCNK